MPLFIASLNSGSNGNCYYIGNREEAVLIDAGISCRETEKRMQRCGLTMSLVKAVFVSHEHGDHISGLTNLSRKYKLPVYITSSTHANTRLRLDMSLVRPFTPCETISIGNLEVTPFSKCHDAADPHSFIVSSEGTTIGIITDIGYACNEVVRYFRQCHAAFLESNYDVEMLANGRYPIHLKKRISGRYGHLSNGDALKLFLEQRSSWMSHLILAHLSKNNNCPEIVRRLFESHAGQTKISIASRYHETPVFEVAGNGEKDFLPLRQERRVRQVQLSLF